MLHGPIIFSFYGSFSTALSLKVAATLTLPQVIIECNCLIKNVQHVHHHGDMRQRALQQCGHEDSIRPTHTYAARRVAYTSEIRQGMRHDAARRVAA